jgi:hypothetical protein
MSEKVCDFLVSGFRECGVQQRFAFPREGMNLPEFRPGEKK